MSKLFVYGTSKKDYCNHSVLGDAEFVKVDCLKGFKMHRLGGFPAIAPYNFNPDNEHPHIVHGEVYEINDKDLYRVNQLEGYSPHSMVHQFYDRQSVVLESGEVALVYYMHECHSPVEETGVW